MRRFVGDRPTEEVSFHATLDEARRAVPGGLVCFERHQNDDQTVVEVWL